MENQVAIKISGLSKKYSISEKHTGNNLSDRLSHFFLLRKNKNKNSEAFYALKDINIEITKGTALGIIGRNGAGKSTLLKILSEIVEPTEGRIDIYGKVASILDVGMGFHPELTGRENVYLSGIIGGLSKKNIDKKFDEIVNFSGVGKFIDTPVKHYSNGMYVRLAFSVITHIEADILLFDEVLNVGDFSFQLKCLNRIQTLAKQGKTLLIVSHNLNDIINWCNNILYLENGLMKKTGGKELIMEYISNAYATDRKIHQEPSRGSTELENVFHQAWDNLSEAPGNEAIRISRIFISSGEQNENSCFYINEPLNVTIEFYKYDDKRIYDFAVILSHLNSRFLCAQSTFSKNGEIPDCSRPGKYIARVQFEKKFFNASYFEMGLSILTDDKKIIWQAPNILSFHLDYKTNCSQSEYFRNAPRFLGPMYPELNWEFKFISPL